MTAFILHAHDELIAPVPGYVCSSAAMQTSSRINHRAAWIDAVASFCSLCAALWLYREAKLAVAWAVREYGHNVDSGLYETIAANWYFIPASGMLGAAAFAMFCNWPYRRFLHWLGWLFVAVPLVWLAASEFLRVAA